MQMNFERKMQELEEEGGAESDEEIRELKRRFLSFNDNDFFKHDILKTHYIYYI